MSKRRTPDSRHFFSSASKLELGLVIEDGSVLSVVETEWSITANVEIGAADFASCQRGVAAKPAASALRGGCDWSM